MNDLGNCFFSLKYFFRNVENELEVSLGDYVEFICPTAGGSLQMFNVQGQEYQDCSLRKGKLPYIYKWNENENAKNKTLAAYNAPKSN